MAKVDKELQQYRNLLKPPSTFEDGFGWTTIAGIFFCGLIMMPGSIYLGLMTGGSIGSAATWVTVILFSEMSRRAMKTMSKGNLIILLYVAGVMMAGNIMIPGGPFGELVFRAYFATSDIVRDMGMRDYLPRWWVPAPDSAAITERNLFHKDWLIPSLLILMVAIYGTISKYTVGYFFFRLCSDVERLPFPLAPVSAQGSLALADSTKKPEELEAEANQVDEEGHKPLSKWRIFTLGSIIGLAFGFIQVGIPAITGLFLDKPVFLIPQPYLDTTTITETILPATPTGITIEPGIIITGMVLPFWAVLGAFAAVVSTLILNPILHASEILVQWQPGMNTVNTTFVNQIDFWLSFGFGSTLAIATVSTFTTIKDVIKRSREAKRQAKLGAEAVNSEDELTERDKAVSSLWKTPNIGRGDWSVPMALAVYAVATAGVLIVVNKLVPGLLLFFIFFLLFYYPFISYVNARLIGLTGQSVDIPYIREGCIILSGYSKIDVWVAPIPFGNYGAQASSFRVNELTGVRFRSLIWADLAALPTLYILSFVFWAFIWKSSPVPSDLFPAARLNWELSAKSSALFMTSTFHPDLYEQATNEQLGISADAAGSDAATGTSAAVADSADKSNLQIKKISTSEAASRFRDTEFARALHPKVIGISFASILAIFGIFTLAGLPTLFVYGMLRGFGQLPHTLIIEIIGAILGRYYLQKKFGKSNWLRSAPALLAGYYTGVGLIGMATVALNLIKNAVSSAPF